MLHPVSRALFQVRSASVDGATGLDALSVTLDDEVLGLVGTPDPGRDDLRLRGRRRSRRRPPAHAEVGDLAGVRADQIDLDPQVTRLAYVG